MNMTLQQVDQLLSLWKSRLSTVAENLLELQADTTYQMLTGTGGFERASVTGETASRVQAALGTMHALFLQFGLLQSLVDRAEALRKKLPAMIGTETKLRELEGLLLSASVEVKREEVPLSQRHLLTGSQTVQRLTPEALLESMTLTFQEVRGAIAAAAEAWTAFAKQGAEIEDELARMRAQVAMPTRLLAPALDAAVQCLEAVKQTAATDPVGALAALQRSVAPELARANHVVRLAEALSLQVRAARSRLQFLITQHQEVVQLLAQAKLQFVAELPASDLMDETTLQALEQWLARLDRKRDETVREAIALGLRNWSAAAEGWIAKEGGLLATCKAQLAQNTELRGRFKALQVKARSRGVERQEPVARMRLRAEELLHAQPVDLRLAASAVAVYEQQLRKQNSAALPLPADGGK